MAYIYKITNNINDKVYIGKTESSVEKRWKEHCRDCRKERCNNRPLYRAMNKYGIENFQVEAIEETDCPEEREIYWIDYYGSYHNGYNATRGGDGKKYLDYDAIIDTYNKVLNLKATAEVHGVSTDSVQEILRAKGVQIRSSEDVLREKLRLEIAMCDKDNRNEILKTFSSIIEAAQYLIDNHIANSPSANHITSHISQVCAGKRKSAYGYSWIYL